MRYRNAAVAVVLLGLLAAACGGKRTDAEKQLFEWAKVLQLHLTTSGFGNYTVPQSLEEIDPTLKMGMSASDPWGSELYYRAIQDDRYQLISAGADRTLGNQDDIVVENGILKNAAKVYAERPLARAS